VTYVREDKWPAFVNGKWIGMGELLENWKVDILPVRITFHPKRIATFAALVPFEKTR